MSQVVFTDGWFGGNPLSGGGWFGGIAADQTPGAFDTSRQTLTGQILDINSGIFSDMVAVDRDERAAILLALLELF